jgi:hypothetical protein
LINVILKNKMGYYIGVADFVIMEELSEEAT